MMKKTTYAALVFSLFVSACDRVDTIKPQYEAKSQLPINANSIVVSYEFNPEAKSRDSDQFFSKAMVRDVERWAKTRFHLMSSEGVAKLTIREATISVLPDMHNVNKLEGRLDVMLSILGQNGAVYSYSEAKVIQTIPVPTGMSEEEYSKSKQVLNTKLIDGLDKEIEASFFKMMGNASPSFGKQIK